MRGKKAGAVSIFIGVLLFVIFAVGLVCEHVERADRMSNWNGALPAVVDAGCDVHRHSGLRGPVKPRERRTATVLVGPVGRLAAASALEHDRILPPPSGMLEH